MHQLVLIVVIISIVYYFIFTNRRIRTISPFFGAIVLIFLGLISFERAISYIDFTKIGIIIGLMIITIIARDSGLFEFLAIKVFRYSKGDSWSLFVFLSILTGILASLTDEITTLLFMANIAIAITSILEISSIPFLISQIIFANIGGIATYWGTHVNIMIGTSAGFSFFDFMYHTAPIAIILAIVSVYYFKIILRKTILKSKFPPEILKNFDKINEKKCIIDQSLFKKIIIITVIVLMVALFPHIFQNDLAVIVPLIALTLVVLTPEKSVHSIYAQIDWAIIFFIIGLNILAGTLEEHGIIDILSRKILEMTKENNTSITLLFLTSNTFLSSFLDNVPIVNLFIPIAKDIIEIVPTMNPIIWITMIIASNMGANGTLIGTASNLIVAEIAENNKQRIGFWYYFRIAFPLVIIHFIISAIYIYLRYLI